MTFFKKFVSKEYHEIKKHLLKKLQLRKYSKGDEVFRHNSMSDKYYIVVAGSVAVFLYKESKQI